MSRDERVDDLYFEDRTAAGQPAEEGLVRLVSGDLRAMLGGQVVTLSSGLAGPVRVQHEIASDQVIPDGFTQLARCPTILAGVTLTIEAGGELFVL